MTPEEFWTRVDKTAPNGCWRWTGSVNKFGYGTVYGYQQNGKRGAQATHRYAYMLAYGEIPAGAHVLHRCNNPICVRPEHLYAGTPQQNAQDRVTAGTSRKGESNPHSKLTEADVSEIRRMHLEGKTMFEISFRFGISTGAASKICQRKTWKHVP